jgi:hypothetical protein
MMAVGDLDWDDKPGGPVGPLAKTPPDTWGNARARRNAERWRERERKRRIGLCTVEGCSAPIDVEPLFGSAGEALRRRRAARCAECSLYFRVTERERRKRVSLDELANKARRRASIDGGSR